MLPLLRKRSATLSDLETTDAGPIKLVSTAGSITVNEGDADDTGVRAATTGDVLLETRAANGEHFLQIPAPSLDYLFDRGRKQTLLVATGLEFDGDGQGTAIRSTHLDLDDNLPLVDPVVAHNGIFL